MKTLAGSWPQFFLSAVEQLQAIATYAETEDKTLK